MKKTYILFSIVFAVALLLAVSEVGAADVFPATPRTAPRECTIPISTTISVKIVAGPDNSGLDPEFPKLVNCPDPNYCLDSDTWSPPLVGQYLMWEYRFTYKGINPSHSVLSLSSDIEVSQAWPSSVISKPGEGDSATNLGLYMYESRVIRYNENASTFLSRYYTKPGLVSRVATAGFMSGKYRGYCLLAGAGELLTDPLQAVTTDVLTDAGGCLVRRTVDARGYTLALEILPGSPSTCGWFTTDPPTIQVGGTATPASFITPEAQMTFGTTTLYCYPYKDTFGNLKTICVNR